MAYIEFVDHVLPQAVEAEAVKGDKGASKRAKAEGKVVAKKKKTARRKKVASKRSTKA